MKLNKSKNNNHSKYHDLSKLSDDSLIIKSCPDCHSMEGHFCRLCSNRIEQSDCFACQGLCFDCMMNESS